MHRNFTMTVIAVLTLAGCQRAKEESPAGKPPVETKAPGPAPEQEGATPTTATHMKEHFDKANEIKAALIAGDLEAARAPARWMAEHQQEADYPDTWQPHVQSMRDAAQKIVAAKDLPAASQAFVSMGETCAACHVALGGPKLEPSAPPAATQGSGTKPHMARHQWALDQMWLGLIGPSRPVWIAGAEALAEAPLVPEQFVEGQTLSPELQALAAHVHELGNKARDVSGTSGIPGMIYGELLVGCETCHAALRPK